MKIIFPGCQMRDLSLALTSDVNDIIIIVITREGPCKRRTNTKHSEYTPYVVISGCFPISKLCSCFGPSTLLFKTIRNQEFLNFEK